MPSPAERLNEIASNLREGKEPPKVTVREFLSWFGAQRRTYWIVKRIRDELDEANIQTEPDFESVYLDSPMTFCLRPERPPKQITPNAVDISVTESITCVEKVSVARLDSYTDPTYRISKLAAANNPPLCVAPDAAVQEAITLMLSNDFSQLPVMTGERDVRGMISWTSIGTRLALEKSGTSAQELMDIHQEIRADASLFQAIPIITQHQYVLIRGSDNRITGIVTASDLSLQFQQLAEPFLLLGEIENHIRRILANKFSASELGEAQDPRDTQRAVSQVSDLTFGEYIRLIENPDRWKKLVLPIDRKIFIKQLDRVREIRNDVMHFDPDPMPPDDLDFLRDLVQFFQRLQGIGVT